MDDRKLRDYLVQLLTESHAHVDFAPALADFPPELRGVRPEGLPHSAWEQLEHLRLAQWDILEFSRDPDHVSPAWPDGYWPPTPEPPDAAAWDASLAAFESDLRAMVDLVADPATDLFAVFPWSERATVLREVLLLADHNAYHLGQIVDLRRLLGAWPAG